MLIFNLIKMKEKEFTIAPRGQQWVVLQWKYSAGGSNGTVIYYCNEKKDAKEMADHLNARMLIDLQEVEI